MKFLRMPDLNEHQEPGQMMTNGDGETDSSVMPGETDSSVMPGETDSSVMPSIPETLLRDLGVDQEKTEEESPDQLSEQELESKFTSLSLAFKTDKITLEKRLEIQERSRDIAEENVAKEIKGLKEALEQLNQICVDSQVRGLLLKIQKHVTVLEQASARVSSRAEVLGAVQQEKRMSKAIEIMLTHVDNLRMSHERQTAELEEARKLIQDNRPFGGSSDLGDFPGLSRRSASVCHGNAFMPKGARRRVSDAALTRSTGLPHSASVDPRSKFQQIASVAALKNSTSSAFRKASLCKQTSTSSLLGQNLRLSQESSQTDNKMTRSVSKQHSAEEEAFQKGFEQGYKAQITGQLKQLRDQQTSITDTLDEIRDKCEEAEEGDTQEISLRDTIVSKVWEHIPEWGTASKNLRLATVIFFLFLAAVSIVLSFLPVGYAAVQVYPEYHHVNTPPV